MDKTRRSIRLWKYDYGQPGSYFVTFCTQDRQCCLSSIAGDTLTLISIGKILKEEIARTTEIRESVKIDSFLIMPNHIHLLIRITQNESLETQSGTLYRQSCSIPSIVAALKAAVTRRAFKDGLILSKKLWQRNYFEHVIRDDDDAERVDKYIRLNPSLWNEDSENPANNGRIAMRPYNDRDGRIAMRPYENIHGKTQSNHS
jgi:putative transposase